MSEATIQFQGRLTNEPQQRQVGNYTVTNIDVAVDGSRKDQQGNTKAEYYRVAIWGNRGNFVRDYLHKGQPVMISGTLTTHQYKRNDGGAGISLDVRADHVDFVLSQPRNQQTSNGFNQQAGQAPAPQNAPQGNNMVNYPNQAQNGPQGQSGPNQQGPQGAGIDFNNPPF